MLRPTRWLPALALLTLAAAALAQDAPLPEPTRESFAETVQRIIAANPSFEDAGVKYSNPQIVSTAARALSDDPREAHGMAQVTYKAADANAETPDRNLELVFGYRNGKWVLLEALAIIPGPKLDRVCIVDYITDPTELMPKMLECEEGKPVQTTDSGLKYVVLEEGAGEKPKVGQTIAAEYTGWLENGKKFDSSKDHAGAFEFPVGQGRVIRGWDEALLDMKVGERRKLILPPDLAYGARGAGNVIPPNATLIFEVKLVAIK